MGMSAVGLCTQVLWRHGASCAAFGCIRRVQWVCICSNRTMLTVAHPEQAWSLRVAGYVAWQQLAYVLPKLLALCQACMLPRYGITAAMRAVWVGDDCINVEGMWCPAGSVHDHFGVLLGHVCIYNVRMLRSSGFVLSAHCCRAVGAARLLRGAYC